MIIGCTQSADGGFRRIPIRHTHIVDEATKKAILEYLYDRIYNICQKSEWIGARDIFPKIPEDIINTPLEIVNDKCKEKFADNPSSINLNIAKYVGMLVREAVYSSTEEYYEIIDYSVRKYSLASKGLSGNSVIINRKLAIAGKYGRKK